MKEDYYNRLFTSMVEVLFEKEADMDPSLVDNLNIKIKEKEKENCRCRKIHGIR